jgi:hypothetical protein
MKLRQLQKAAAKSSAQAKAAKNRFAMLTDHAKVAKELVKAVKIKFKVTRKALKQARKNADLCALDRKQAGKQFEKAAALAAKYQKRLNKAKHQTIPHSKSEKRPVVLKPKHGPAAAERKSEKKILPRSKRRVQRRRKKAAPKVNRFISLKPQTASAPISVEQTFATTPTLDTPEKIS